MKKVVIISAVIAAIAAIVAICAAGTGLFNPAEAEKPAVEQEIQQNNFNKPFKTPQLKFRKAPVLDKEKIREKLKKKKEKHQEETNSQETGSCGE